MKLSKKCLAAFVGVFLFSLLSACGFGGVSAEDATTYVQGELDAAYLGKYNEDYLDLMDLTEDDAANSHMANVSAEAEYYLQYLGVYDIESLPEDVVSYAEETIEKIYAKSNYTVNSATQTEAGDYNVDITIYPIDIMQQLTAQISDIWLTVTDGYTQEDLDAMSDAEYNALDAEYARQATALLESLIPNIGYETPQSVVLKLQLVDNVYTAVETDFANIDMMMIDYTGAYQ